ncbi:Phosphoribosylformimino-5-aminoimidazole carboxamide ribotide isomerase [Violaceomyces palustris]|uniref:Phosphoribosylformimino-5-aminoimidazole carboxamide ribotide isomerase n=1 Tax=Violaceomyces palustris TaxID=1673888 RepID=A0ACD0NUG0_9BASI|nr:Phosphoribosylformimino-5-aminoimidazole carboxamide ribotide isomerase [Violaceomyces palustris]
MSQSQKQGSGIVLHHLAASRSLRVSWLLEELQAPYTLKFHPRHPVTRLAQDELKAVHPLGRSPVIVDDGITVAETGAIFQHLLLHHYDPSKVQLGPRPTERSQQVADQSFWIEFSEASVMLHIFPFFYLIKGGDATKDGSLGTERASSRGLKIDLAFIEDTLAKNGGYLLERGFGPADCANVVSVELVQRILDSRPSEWRQNLGLAIGPKTLEWLETCRSRPAYNAALRKEGLDQGDDWLAALLGKDTRAEKRRKSVFRPCIDLHEGVVKQIVGGTLTDGEGPGNGLKTNFVATHAPSYFSELYKSHDLRGGHVIKLGPRNDEAATSALEAWPKGLHVGGGINASNAREWLDKGAEKVIVTSYLFPDCKFSLERLEALRDLVGRENLVVDVSCRRKGDKWIVAMNRWQDMTDMEVNAESLKLLSDYCSEFLIHAADVEGLCQGIDQELAKRLGEWCTIPTTYAGGARNLGDLELVDQLSGGKVDLTFGSALDVFGGSGVKLDELVDWNKRA